MITQIKVLSGLVSQLGFHMGFVHLLLVSLLKGILHIGSDPTPHLNLTTSLKVLSPNSGHQHESLKAAQFSVI
jgi:hypothetical protein